MIVLCTVLFHLTLGTVHNHYEESNETTIARGDQILQCDQNDDIYRPPGTSRSRRAVSSETSRLWPYGIIPYVIEPGIPEEIVTMLKSAMDHWSRETCIRFTRRSLEDDYVSFYNGVNCCSWVGKVGGKQPVSVGSRCSSFGVLIHELGHVIGFWHEHSRPDRDNYIKVIPENLVLGAVRNFEKLPNSKVNSFGKLYDYKSIMHYGPRHFSSNWKNTIETRLADAQDYIGQRHSLSMGDIEQAKILYECPRDANACSSMVKDGHGRLSSPGYPMNYLPSQDCITIIQPDMVGYVLVARILDVDMPQSSKSSCSGDHIEIRDGPYHDSPLVTRVCGKSHSDAIISVSGTLYIRFRSDLQGSGRGYLLEFETQDLDECVRGNGGCSHTCHNTPGAFYCSCPPSWHLARRGDYCIDPGTSGSCSGFLDGESGTLASLGYPDPYMAGLSCYWGIYPPTARYIHLKFHDFDLETGGGGPDCLYDYVEVSAGFEKVRYCGKSLPPVLTFNSTSISLRFNSDASQAGRGFLATYTTTPAEADSETCTTILNTVRGEIVYRRGEEKCDERTYIISLPSSFQLSYKYSGIMRGKVSIYTTKLLKMYKDHTRPSATVRTYSNTLRVVANSMHPHDQFSLSWKSADTGSCGGYLRAPKTSSISIYSHHSYNTTSLAPYQTCVWHLASKHRVYLSAVAFDLTDTTSVFKRRGERRSRARKYRRNTVRMCVSNYLEIIDGGRKVGRFCNDRKLTVFSSKTSTVKLKLVTRGVDPGEGFHIKFSRLTVT